MPIIVLARWFPGIVVDLIGTVGDMVMNDHCGVCWISPTSLLLLLLLPIGFVPSLLLGRIVEHGLVYSDV